MGNLEENIFNLLISDASETEALRSHLKVNEVKQLAKFLALNKDSFLINDCCDNTVQSNIILEDDVAEEISIWTDGSCFCNPGGAGGWAFIIDVDGDKKEFSGGVLSTTNNKMELLAVIEALKYIKENINIIVTQETKITLYSDSKYVCDSINKGWASSWKNNGWIKSNKKPALNVDLWEELLNLIKMYNVQFVWVKGHSSIPENNRCDKLAVEQSKKFQRLKNL